MLASIDACKGPAVETTPSCTSSEVTLTASASQLPVDTWTSLSVTAIRGDAQVTEVDAGTQPTVTWTQSGMGTGAFISTTSASTSFLCTSPGGVMVTATIKLPGASTCASSTVITCQPLGVALTDGGLSACSEDVCVSVSCDPASESDAGPAALGAAIGNCNEALSAALDASPIDDAEDGGINAAFPSLASCVQRVEGCNVTLGADDLLTLGSPPPPQSYGYPLWFLPSGLNVQQCETNLSQTVACPAAPIPSTCACLEKNNFNAQQMACSPGDTAAINLCASNDISIANDISGYLIGQKLGPVSKYLAQALCIVGAELDYLSCQCQSLKDNIVTCPPCQTCLESNGLCDDTGLQVCNDQCVDPNTDKNNCGGCGKVCPTGTTFPCCKGQCVDTSSDPSNCGMCGNMCASGQCVGGACAASDDGGSGDGGIAMCSASSLGIPVVTNACIMITNGVGECIEGIRANGVNAGQISCPTGSTSAAGCPTAAGGCCIQLLNGSGAGTATCYYAPAGGVALFEANCAGTLSAGGGTDVLCWSPTVP